MVAVRYPHKYNLGHPGASWRELIHCSKASVHTFTDDDLKDLDIEAIKLMQKKTAEEVHAN